MHVECIIHLRLSHTYYFSIPGIGSWACNHWGREKRTFVEWASRLVDKEGGLAGGVSVFDQVEQWPQKLPELTVLRVHVQVMRYSGNFMKK